MWLWYLDPRYPRNILNPKSFVDGGREQLCLWYAFEMAVRQEKVEEYRLTIEGLGFDAAALARQFFDSEKRL